MKNIIILLLLASLFVSFLPLDVHATSSTLSDESSCNGIGGTWNSITNTCTIQNVTINSGDILTISNGVELSIKAGLTINSGGTVSNYGTITVSSCCASGLINNFGGIIINSGTIKIEPTATFINNGITTNSGIIDNYSVGESCTGCADSGIINGGTIDNEGIIRNHCGGTIQNSGTIGGESIINESCITSGRMTGIGALDSNTKFVFDVKSNGTAIKGGIQYADKTGKTLLQSVSITAFNINSDGIHGTFGGTAKVNATSGFTFTATVEDHGTPGNNDKFSIAINELSYTKSGTLALGNIAVHK